MTLDDLNELFKAFRIIIRKIVRPF